ncbi:hypothetical protein KNE206_51140 [Kitasatospora sp. NE20-6]|uniref:RICIN domain-containing protein n=1 Tax=Kitasatospora sp. NE20-6 TaxID=2859066 RepID=UPI0034DC9AEA
MPSSSRDPKRVTAGIPGIFTVELDRDDIAGLFRRRTWSRGPFVLVGRDSGLALDTAYRGSGGKPTLWTVHARPHQLWYFERTRRKGEFLIRSADNGLVLDARQGAELRRSPVMKPRDEYRNQHWRLHSTEDATGYIIESVNSGHVLDVPFEAGPRTESSPVLWTRHGSMNQQFLVMTPSAGPT